MMSAAFALGTIAVLAVTLDAGVPGRRVAGLVTAAGLDQDWRLFAPDPPQAGMRLEAVTTWSDGARTLWHMPTDGALFGAYRDYRWRKWAENAGADDAGPKLWRPAVRYFAARLPRRPGATPLEVAIVRRTRWLPAPGDPGGAPWVAVVLYRARLAAGS
jgi:hypothetical protein